MTLRWATTDFAKEMAASNLAKLNYILGFVDNF